MANCGQELTFLACNCAKERKVRNCKGHILYNFMQGRYKKEGNTTEQRKSKGVECYKDGAKIKRGRMGISL